MPASFGPMHWKRHEGQEKDMNEIHTLQRIVFPDSDFINQVDLFYRAWEVYGDLGDGRPVPGRRCFLDTWMNLFAAKQWYKYCDLGTLYLRITGTGKCRLDIQGHTFSVVHGALTETLASLACDFGEGESTRLLPVPDASLMDGVSLAVFHGEQEGFRITEAAWCTDAPPRRKHRMAVVCCTYRRERYVKKNLRKFEGLMAAHPELSGRLHLFVSDNGRTLPGSLGGAHVDLLPNINAGGAGGFARGLMAANDGGYTRCLFMDDDVVLCPETLLRTLALADFLKEEHKDAFINGAMMSLYDRTICSESVTVRNGFWLKGYHAQVPVDGLEGVLRCVSVGDRIYEETFVSSSWWYACFSLDLYRGEYPIPCFIRGDDCEWSWRRRGVHHIAVNGICVWHTPFDYNTRRLIDHYFLPRNMYLVHSVYNQEFREEFFGYLNAFFQHFMDTWNYVSMELFLSALWDILKGWRCFLENPESLMARLRGICAEAEAMPCDDVEKLVRIRKMEDGAAVVDWFPKKESFAGKKEVEVYNLVTQSCETRRPDRRRQEWQTDEFELLALRLHGEYDALGKHLREGFRELTNREFWDRYLGLSGEEELEAQKAGGKGEAEGEVIALEDSVELLLALWEVCLGAAPGEGDSFGESLEQAMQEAVNHQVVMALEHCFAEKWPQISRSAQERRNVWEEAPSPDAPSVLTLRAEHLSAAALGMDFLRELEKTGDMEELQRMREDEKAFFCAVARYAKGREPSEEARSFLEGCLERAAGRFSDFRNEIRVNIG